VRLPKAGARRPGTVVQSSIMATVRPHERREPGIAARTQTRRRRAGGVAPRLGAAVACIVLGGAACTSSRGTSGSVRITPDQLLAGDALGAAAHSPVSAVEEQDVLAVSPEMREFLNKHVNRKGSDELKLDQLVSAIMDSKTFGVKYDTTTRTASETFRMRLGNCLSFSNMFVAMARDVGLHVQFQEVDIPPDWTLDKDTYVLNQHVDVRVDLRPGGARVVDFNIADFRSSYEMRTIPDSRALSHYYNNIGVERMLGGDTASALWCFRKAIGEEDRRYSPAWTNLGTLYLRRGHPAHAEAAYLQALEANGEDLVAMSDLARLYERLGEAQRAAAYRKKVIRHRWLNPYYRYELAREAYRAKRYDAAIGHLKYAIRQRPREDQFCFLLSLSYLGKGDTRAAQRWMAKAEEVAAGDPLKRKYARKIDILLGEGAPTPH
jgi:Flp pilus assembly protein TadD